jgi:hypothetical protein
VNKQRSFQSRAYAELVTAAERELRAFVCAVTQLYGAEQSKLSAIDWLDEFESINNIQESASYDLRLVTVRAAVRLVDRLFVEFPLSNIAAPPRDTNVSAIPSSNCSAVRRLM